MSAGWVAGGVRARAMTRRRLGRAGTRQLALSPSADAAVAALARTPYGHDVRAGQDLAEAQRAVFRTVLWNLRVLAGWLPRPGVAALRLLVAAFEVADVELHLRALAGADADAGEPYRLGGLATAWTRLRATASPAELRGALTASPWGDPGGESAREIGLAMRFALADRVMAGVPLATEWAAGAAALVLARELALHQAELPPRARVAAVRALGPAVTGAVTLPDLAAALPRSARWAIADLAGPDQLWLAEARWWARVERDASALARRAALGPEALVAAAALLTVDAWRVRAALEVAARGGGGPALEAFDALA